MQSSEDRPVAEVQNIGGDAGSIHSLSFKIDKIVSGRMVFGNNQRHEDKAERLEKDRAAELTCCCY